MSIKWEENFNYSIGIDFGLYNNCIFGSIDYYNRRIYDLFFFKLFFFIMGWVLCLVNVGEMLNFGIEFEVIGDVICSNDFIVFLYGSILINCNKIIKLDNNGEDIINVNSGVSLL